MACSACSPTVGVLGQFCCCCCAVSIAQRVCFASERSAWTLCVKEVHVESGWGQLERHHPATAVVQPPTDGRWAVQRFLQHAATVRVVLSFSCSFRLVCFDWFFRVKTSPSHVVVWHKCRQLVLHVTCVNPPSLCLIHRPKWYVDEHGDATLLFTGVNRQRDGGMGHTWNAVSFVVLCQIVLHSRHKREQVAHNTEKCHAISGL